METRSGQLVDPSTVGGQNALALYDPATGGVRDQELSLREVWHVIRKHWRTIAIVTAIVFVTGVLGALMMRPVYQATTLIEVNPSGGANVTFENVQQERVLSRAREFLATQATIIRSESVGKAVIERLDLKRDPEMSGRIKQRGFVTGLKQLVGGGSNEGPAAERGVLARYLNRLSVEPVRSAYLFEVKFEAFDPERAARVANAVAEEYIRLNAERKFSSSSDAQEFLQQEIEAIQAKLESSERDLNQFAKQNDMVDFDTIQGGPSTDSEGGSEGDSNILSVRVSALNEELTRVRAERIDAESAFRMARESGSELLPRVATTPLIQSLRERESTLEAEYQRLNEIYKPGYPALQRARSELSQVRASLSREIAAQVQGLEIRFRELETREALLAEELARAKAELLDLQDRSVQYNILKREWETNKELYSGLLERMKQVGVAEGLQQNNIAIIDEATPPLGPIKPNLPIVAAASLGLGLFGGVALAFLLAFLDNTVRTSEELEHLVSLPVLGLVPRLDEANETQQDKGRIDLSTHLAPDGPLAEAFRSIRTSLMFSTTQGLPKTIMMVSASPSEGKSTAAANLAETIANTGAKVLLLDGDLRKPRLHRSFKVPVAPGLSEHLVGGPLQHTHDTFVTGLTIMSAGTPPPNPAELLGTKTFDVFLQMMKEKYDHIVIDAAPVLGLADSVVMSTKVDAAVLVVSAGKVSKDALRNAVKRMRTVGGRLVGAILNNVDISSGEYSDYAKYYYNYGAQDGGGRKRRSKVASLADRKRAAP